jgi:hypothetical protein
MKKTILSIEDRSFLYPYRVILTVEAIDESQWANAVPATQRETMAEEFAKRLVRHLDADMFCFRQEWVH